MPDFDAEFESDEVRPALLLTSVTQLWLLLCCLAPHVPSMGLRMVWMSRTRRWGCYSGMGSCVATAVWARVLLQRYGLGVFVQLVRQLDRH